MSVQLQEQAGTIGVRRLAGNIGAQITGVDIARPLTPEVVAEIRQALLGPTGFKSEIVEGKPFLSDADVKVG
jgi:hypothetical protein